MTGSVTGALACSAASPVVAFVRTRTDHQLNGRATFKILTDPLPSPFQPQVVGPIGAHAGTVAGTSSACVTCKSTALLCPVAANLAYLD